MPEGSGIKVSLRCRPLGSTEKTNGDTRIVKINGDKVFLHNPLSTGANKEHNFSFDHCYSAETKNVELYKDVGEPLLKKSLEGYNVSVIAVGQTGSGKSYTLDGSIEEDGLVKMVTQTLFNVIEDAANIKDYQVIVSYIEVGDSHVHDLINPSGRNLNIRQHPQLGLYVDDMAEIVANSSEDVVRLHDQGNRIRKLVAAHPNIIDRSSSVFTITIEQKAKDTTSYGKKVRSMFSFVDMTGSDHTSKSEDAPFTCSSLNSLQQVVSAINNGVKSESIPYRDSKLTRLLQNSFGGNGICSMIAHLSPSDSDYSESFATLKFALSVKYVQNIPKRNENDSSLVIKELREEISKLRDQLATMNSMVDTPNNADVARMEDLIKDLQLAKMQTWEEKQRMSDMFLEERHHHLANKGILDWVLDSMKKGSHEIQSKLTNLQKDKERMMMEYKDKRKVVDDLKDSLQKMITEYSMITEQGKGSEEEGKQKVAEIHQMKEKLKQQNDYLKRLKQNLKDVQEKQKNEKEDAKSHANSLKGNMELRFKLETENRDKMEKENHQTLADEMDRIKMETEQEKAELKIKKTTASAVNVDDLIRVEMELLDLKSEKSAMAIKLRSMENEKKQVVKDLNELYKRQKEEMEIQQLQHFQTFRHYREAFEEQKAALEQRYRGLLEDSIQDAVYLSSRNQELSDENQSLKQEIAELKDKVSMAGIPQ